MKKKSIRKCIYDRSLPGKIAAISIALFLCCAAIPAFAGEDEVTLEQARDQFLKHNSDILINQYEVKKAEADLKGAKLLPNPAFSVNYTGLETSTLRTGDNTQTTYRIDQLIELGGKRGYRTKAASETLESTRLSQEDAARALLANFYTLFFNLSLDLLNVTLAREELEQSRKTLEIAEKRFDAGFLSDADYTKLKVAQTDQESGVLVLENQYRNDIEQFRLMIGSEKPKAPLQGQLREAFSEYGEEELVGKAYQRRPDLLSLERQLKSEDYNVSLAKASAIPDLTVGAEYEYFGQLRQRGVGFGISFAIPLFDRNQGGIAHRRAEYRQTEFQIEKTRNRIESDVRTAIQNYRTAVKVYESYSQKRTDVEKLLANSEKAFALGGITVLDLLDTRKTCKEFMAKYNQAIVQGNLSEELLTVYTGELPWLK